MAYITNTVFNRLVMNIDTSSNSDIDINKLFEGILEDKRLLKLFNSLELKRLYNVKYLLENESYEDIKVLKYVEPKKDDYRFVNNRGGNLKYHFFQDCEVLIRDFEDYKIPFKVDKINSNEVKALVEDYRQWFLSNKYSELIDKKGVEGNQIIAFHYNSYFSKKYNLPSIPDSFRFKETHLNRGYRSFDNSFSIEDFTHNLKLLLDEREKLCNSLTMMYLAKFDFLYQKSETESDQYLSRYYNEKSLDSSFIANYGYERLVVFWKNHLEIKRKIRKLLIDYFMWNSNFKNKQFDKTFLENFGLQCCKVCIKRQSSPEFQAML